MKKILAIAAICFLGAFTAVHAAPTEKVLAAFSKTFNSARDISWTEFDNRYEATFRQNEVSFRVLYDAEGNVLKSMRYYSGQNLPIILQSKLAKKFPSKTIFGVTEVTTENEVSYFVVLEDEKEFQHVRADAFGNITTEQRYYKAL